MKFLALGLFMFLPTMSLFLQSGQPQKPRNTEFHGNATTYDPSTGKIYQSGKEFVPVSGGAPPQRNPGVGSEQKGTGPDAEPTMTWNSVYWDGKQGVSDPIIFSSKDTLGRQSLTVPGDWRCTPFTHGKTDPDLIGMVCTKPKQK
jgi:hypothetical protein